MKIALLSYYSGKANRGAETFVHELSQNLTAIGLSVIVYQNHSPSFNHTYQIRFPTSPLSSITRFTFWAISHLEPDVSVIFPNNGRSQTLISRLWALFYRRKMIIVGHSGPGFDDRFNLYLFPDRFIAVSHSQLNWARSVNPFVKLALITDGVNINQFNPSEKPIELDLPRPIILCIGAFIDSKRHDLAIRAIARLNRGSLLLVGWGPNQNNLEGLASQLLPGRYQCLRASYEDLPRIYATADLFTFPSVPWEASGLVLYEAMASNLPVVATDDPIRREIVGDAGLFVDPVNTHAYTSALARALITDWKDAPRLQALKNSWREVAKKYAHLFEEI